MPVAVQNLNSCIQPIRKEDKLHTTVCIKTIVSHVGYWFCLPLSSMMRSKRRSAPFALLHDYNSVNVLILSRTVLTFKCQTVGRETLEALLSTAGLAGSLRETLIVSD